MYVTMVNAEAAEALRQMGVAGRGVASANGYEVPVWGLQVWSIKERCERGAGFGWGRAASAVVDHLRGLGDDPEAVAEFLDAVLAVQAMSGDGAVVAMCQRGVRTPPGKRVVQTTVAPGVVVRCVPEGRGNGVGRRTASDRNGMRVRAVSAGYDPDHNIQFPREVREPGGFFIVPVLKLAGRDAAPFYRTSGVIRPLLESA